MIFLRVRWISVVIVACSTGVIGCDDVGADPVNRPGPVDAGSDLSSMTDASSEADVARDAGTELRDVSTELRDVNTDSQDDPDAPRGDAAGVLAMRTSACSECALANCQSYIDGCDQVVGKALHGPAIGARCSALCSDALSCLLSTECAEGGDQRNCVCGPFTVTGSSSDCTNFPETATGPCRSAFERSFEETTITEVIGSFTDLSKGGGWATLLYRCLSDYHCAACFPDPTDGGGEGGD